MKHKLKVGDLIKCHDTEDCLKYHDELAKHDIMTDFLYEKDGEKGLWLEIISIGTKE